MLNPILKTKQSLLIYLALWVIIMIAHFINLFMFYELDLDLAIADSLIFNGTLGLLGMVIWYVVRWNTTDNQDVLSILLTHAVASVAMIAGWLAFGNFVMGAFFDEYHFVIENFWFQSGWRIFVGFFIYSILTLIYYGLINNENLQEKIRAEDKLKNLVKEAELSALKSQINPHFLFNSLNSISSLTMSNPANAQEMIIQLSEFLRYTISHKDKDLVSLEDELDNIELYLNIEKVRFGDKIQIENRISDVCLKARIPSMILQPLFENAVKYGVSERTETTTIRTICISENGYLKLIISNECSEQPPRKRGAGLGLKNIEERLKLIYRHHQLMSYEKQETSFEVKLLIPQEEQDYGNN